MLDKEYYKKLFFNEETGKERYTLIPKEAESIYQNNSLNKCWDIAIECYNCELYYIQMMAVYIMGLIAYKNKQALDFLKNTVSKNPSWQVQEFLGMAFDNYCKDNGYEKSLEIINEWLNDKNENVRRAVTEGLRSWVKRPYFQDNPQEAIKILTQYKTDESEYVRKSVGNALKDISKKYPELIKEEIKKWKLDTKEINQVYKLASKLFE
ncbi:MAG: DNA alkylation repair protein [Ignavibacteria bacterium]|jgi:3-methyladenine DNA glycosylase AlkC|nr:DNA alkylation repair protein [Ignavibacteria bacterium]